MASNERKCKINAKSFNSGAASCKPQATSLCSGLNGLWLVAALLQCLVHQSLELIVDLPMRIGKLI